VSQSEADSLSLRIRVFILASNRLLREALGRILQKRADITVSGESGGATDATWSILESKPDVVLIGATGSSVSFQIIQTLVSSPLPPHVLLIGMEDNESVFLESVRAGAAGYLLKDASASDVIAAVRAVSQGEAVCPPRLCRYLFRQVARGKQDVPFIEVRKDLGLTRRQVELIPLIAQGLTNKEIASQLNLSEQTIKNHIHRMLQKVGAEDRLEVTRMADSKASQSPYLLDS
jgi:DNA-binding NarL/FixJ family response regulator